MSVPFTRIGIAGVGLIGGSIAMASRRLPTPPFVVGFDPRADLDLGSVVDERVGTLEELSLADVIFVCAPVSEMARTLAVLGGTGTPALITDVCSTKRRVMAAAANAGLGAFVGGHPMAGSERPGLASARPDLFRGRPWLLVEGSLARAAAARLEVFLRGLGAVTRWMDAEQHDRTVAYISHLPQIVAAALMNAADLGVPFDGPHAAGNAFGEMTRLAASPGTMWQSVLDENADFVAEALEAFRLQLPGGTQPGSWASDALARSGDARARWLSIKAKQS